MELHRVQADSKLNIDGKYKGNYTINIEYDLSRLADAIRQYTERHYRGYPEIESVSVNVTNPGTTSAKRTLSGEAEALVMVYNPLVTNLRGSRCSIEPNQKSDEKDVSVSNIAMHVTLSNKEYDSVTNGDDGYSADARIISYSNKNYNIRHVGLTVASPDQESRLYWEEMGNMYQRGNRATDGWHMFLTPMHSAYTPLY